MRIRLVPLLVSTATLLVSLHTASARGTALPPLSPAAAKKVGNKIWKNECAGTVDGLTSWNKGEAFASLGIGHFIWYPAGKRGPYKESFPSLLNFLQVSGVRLPGWLQGAPACPWQDRTAFQSAFRGAQMNELRRLLADTVPQQTSFLIRRLESALPAMLEQTPRKNRDLVRGRFYAVAETPSGNYALIDYVNFKGEGTSPSERYKGQGWGLLQVLEGMEGAPRGADAARAFSSSAKRVLQRRVRNAPKDETRWLKGWMNRCETYARPL